jgi:hypothetical protein
MSQYILQWLTTLQTWNTKSSIFLKGDKIPEKLVNINLPGKDSKPGFQEVESHTFQDNRQMKAVKLFALRTGHLGNIPVTQLRWRLS